MKIVTYVLVALLVVALAGGAYFYMIPYKQLAAEYEKLRAGQPEFDRARKELAKYKEREKANSGWTGPAAERLRTGLAREISEGTAEVVVADDRVVLNISEKALYTPNSVTFAKDSQQELANLAAVLKDFKDREVLIGNATVPAPAQGKGRKRIPAKDARTLASGRTLALVKYLAQNGVADETLVAAAYPAKMPDRGFKLKGEKVIIVVAAPAVSEALPAPAKPDTRPAVSTKTTPTPAAASQIKTIPISTVPPKKLQ